MERLTVKWKDGLYDCFDPIDIIDNEYSKINYEKLLTKLGMYEDAEEQGLFLKAPCKIGDTVFRINKGAINPIIPMVVTEIRYKALRSGKVIIKLMCSDDIMTKTDGCSVYYEEEIGKKIFLSKEDVEKALVKLSN